MNASSLKTAAEIARKNFIRAIRANDTEYMIVKPNAPEWVHDLAHAAHGDQLPNDERFQFIIGALDAIMDHDGDREEACSSLEPAVYTQELLQWLASVTSRYDYCDQAREEYGIAEDAGLIERLQMGQLHEMTETFHLVCDFLERESSVDEAIEQRYAEEVRHAN